jgi:alkanesulfonate monooxygenase
MTLTPMISPDNRFQHKTITADKCLEVFATCPSSRTAIDGNYYQQIADVARWSEEQGCRGILVYSDNSIVDPWLVSQIIIENTEALCPLVAVQPIYMHPYTVAKMVTTFASLYGRKIYLNMIAGGFKNDLLALNDTTPHDNRYDRLQEYTLIIKGLLQGECPLSFQGEYYTTDKLKLLPALDQTLYPGIFISGSSAAGIAAAKATGATAIQYPKPVHDYAEPLSNEEPAPGIRIGIISRESDEQAWSVAHERFPEDRKGQLTYQLAMKVTDSVWHKQLSKIDGTIENSPYWLVPLQNYKTSCPYLVGSYARVGEQLSGYITSGYRTLILDVPPDRDELIHTRMALDHVRI